jgi:hypothetical protein
MTYRSLELVIVGKPDAVPWRCKEAPSIAQSGLAGLALGGHRGCINLSTNLIYVGYCTVRTHLTAPTAHGSPLRAAIIFSRKERTTESLLPLDLVRPLICCSISDPLCAFQAWNTPLKAFGNTATCANARGHLAYNDTNSAAPRTFSKLSKATRAGSYSVFSLG